ncbi:hemerythrin domain-containing protein [Roseivivax isoporae]|uniref:Hemerythrin n=1 Tax=Roseivivax isoporae LMG 25204 TaxID=1449351 RepID=X7FA96_9RHOB|nr:hemerythrin domain-containing protein [Roseivivax isoporae]ETX29735.1 Hemerythrin [Roseivivax isoporae LMG 25204]
MSIYDAIRADHARHRELLATIADTEGASEARKDAWSEFFRDVKSHAAAEEETFYSKLMSKTWGQDAARHSVEEHAQMDDMMEELHGMDMSSPEWLKTFNKLRDEYEHHMEEEEDEVFGRAREVIPEEEIEGYGERFRARKERELDLVEAKREDQLED